VNEFGDVSEGARSTGKHFNPHNVSSHGAPGATRRHAGDLGNLLVNEQGEGYARMLDDQLKVWDLIGRSVVVDSAEDIFAADYRGEGLSWGIIARAAVVGENKKKICTCDDPQF